MILYDTECYGKPKLTKFEGGMTELKSREITKSLKKAKAMVLEHLKHDRDEIDRKIAEVESINKPSDLGMSRNPYGF